MLKFVFLCAILSNRLYKFIIPLKANIFQVYFEIYPRFFDMNTEMLIKKEYTAEFFDDNGVPAIKLTGDELPDVGKTFDCGQCFRFERVADSKHECEYSGVAYGRFVSFASDGGALYIYNATKEDLLSVWESYLGLADGYGRIAEDVISRSDSAALKNAVEYGKGIHILRQEHWETLCSFIISQNNNIPRIKKIVSALCREIGTPIDTKNMMSHGAKEVEYAFPDARAVEKYGTDNLFALKTGFRAKYIYDAAQKVSSGELDLDSVLNAESISVGAQLLCSVKGVGPKVAACTLLFGFGKHDAFPIDVWIKRAIEKYFPGEFDAARLGPYAGIAQQYLFYYERYLGGESTEEK